MSILHLLLIITQVEKQLWNLIVIFSFYMHKFAIRFLNCSDGIVFFIFHFKHTLPNILKRVEFERVIQSKTETNIFLWLVKFWHVSTASKSHTICYCKSLYLTSRFESLNFFKILQWAPITKPTVKSQFR